MNILEFPCILLLEIFSYIDKRTILASVRKVCKYFHRLSIDRSIWKTVSMNQFPRTMFTTIIFHELLSEVQNYVHFLHFNMEQLDDNGILHEGITCSNLKELYIYANPYNMLRKKGYDYSDFKQLIEDSEEWKHILILKKYISSFGEKYPYLKALHIQSGGLNVGYLSDRFLNLETLSISEGFFQDSCREFFENHPSIRHLSLKKCMIEPSAVPIVLSQLPNLETLNLSGTKDYFDDWHTEANVVQYDQLCRLRELCIDDNGDKFLSHICNNMPELRKLSLKGSGYKDKELIEIAKHCPKLETLLISNQRGNYGITNDALFAIAASCKNLKVLQANYCTEIDRIGIQRIIESCQNLRELEIARCKSLTDDDMFSWVENCPRIQKLNLLGCTGLTSKSISAILVGFESLTNLDLENCRNLDIRITDDSKQNIMSTDEDSEIGTVETDKTRTEIIKVDGEMYYCNKTCKAHSHVRTLNLSRSYISDKYLEQLSSFCPDLRDVDLSGCSMLTNQGVTTLIHNCTLLEKLKLIFVHSIVDNYHKLSEECLSSIAKYCKNLSILIIHTDVEETADALFNVIQDCPRIEYIKLTGRISTDKLKMLVRNVSGKVVRINKDSFISMEIYIYRANS